MDDERRDTQLVLSPCHIRSRRTHKWLRGSDAPDLMFRDAAYFSVGSDGHVLGYGGLYRDVISKARPRVDRRFEGRSMSLHIHHLSPSLMVRLE